mmetsp:Transcript_6686/g.16151  ORF Transcript_6686/g.16151 Transcript_6686/m.16151 type:complete len:214 (-) Transcript_6686:39-680(-)
MQRTSESRASSKRRMRSAESAAGVRACSALSLNFCWELASAGSGAAREEAAADSADATSASVDSAFRICSAARCSTARAEASSSNSPPGVHAHLRVSRASIGQREPSSAGSSGLEAAVRYERSESSEGGVRTIARTPGFARTVGRWPSGWMNHASLCIRKCVGGGAADSSGGGGRRLGVFSPFCAFSCPSTSGCAPTHSLPSNQRCRCGGMVS